MGGGVENVKIPKENRNLRFADTNSRARQNPSRLAGSRRRPVSRTCVPMHRPCLPRGQAAKASSSSKALERKETARPQKGGNLQHGIYKKSLQPSGGSPRPAQVVPVAATSRFVGVWPQSRTPRTPCAKAQLGTRETPQPSTCVHWWRRKQRRQRIGPQLCGTKRACRRKAVASEQRKGSPTTLRAAENLRVDPPAPGSHIRNF